jgi:hypothetical protein
VIDYRAAMHIGVHFAPLKQFHFAAHAARSLRRNLEADPQLQLPADAREVTGQC